MSEQKAAGPDYEAGRRAGLELAAQACELAARKAGASWVGYYNAGRPHSALAGRTPDEAYGANEMEALAA
jgi:Integrase core domain